MSPYEERCLERDRYLQMVQYLIRKYNLPEDNATLYQATKQFVESRRQGAKRRD